MESLSYKTISANAATVTKEWVLIDATDAVVGRLASQVAKILRGKNKPSFTPHVDCGDNVIIINADKVKFTGKKMTDKVYVRHTGLSRRASVTPLRPITCVRSPSSSSKRPSRACCPVPVWARRCCAT